MHARPITALSIALALLAATAASAGPDTAKAAVAADFQIYDATTVRGNDTLATLRQRLGQDNVIAGEVPGAEDTEPGWIIHPRDPKRRIYVYLDEQGKHPGTLAVRDGGSRWRTPENVHMGLTSAELAARNLKPFTFTGFNWDYGGRVSDWHGGRLRHASGVVLCPPEFPGGRQPKGYPEGDAAFVSTLPILARFPPKVCGFELEIAPAANFPAAH